MLLQEKLSYPWPWAETFLGNVGVNIYAAKCVLASISPSRSCLLLASLLESRSFHMGLKRETRLVVPVI
jgi:hypothetical protein